MLATRLRGDYEPRIVHGRDPSTRALSTLALLLLASTIAYSGSFQGEWVSDDVTAIAESPIVRSLAP